MSLFYLKTYLTVLTESRINGEVGNNIRKFSKGEENTAKKNSHLVEKEFQAKNKLQFRNLKISQICLFSSY